MTVVRPVDYEKFWQPRAVAEIKIKLTMNVLYL
jgi:hypothetical protein